MAAPGRIRRVLPVFIILFLAPIVVILLFKFGKNVYKPLPYIGTPTGIDSKGDTIRHKVRDFVFTDQYGKAFGADSLKGKIHIANFFFTSCPNICPLMTQNLQRVQGKFKDDKDFRIVSFTLDPKRDTAARLKWYADKYKINTYQWHFVTSTKDQIASVMGEDGYLVVKPVEGANPDQLQHSDLVILVDKEGHIRGNYHGTKEEDIDKLIEDAHTLYVAYARNNHK